MKAKELREKTEGEREKLLAELARKAREVRFGIASKEVKNMKEYRSAKKTVARILTIARESND